MSTTSGYRSRPSARCTRPATPHHAGGERAFWGLRHQGTRTETEEGSLAVGAESTKRDPRDGGGRPFLESKTGQTGKRSYWYESAFPWGSKVAAVTTVFAEVFSLWFLASSSAVDDTD